MSQDKFSRTIKMITYRYLWFSVVLSLYVCTGGSPLREDLASWQPGRIKGEKYFRARKLGLLRSAFNKGNDDTTVINVTSEVETLSYIFSVNYSLLVDFYLFQRNNKDIEVTKLPVDATGVVNAGFKKSHITKFVIHGFANDLNSDFIQQVSHGYASNYDYNVVAVDWGKIANDMIYPTARYHVEGVGKYVGQFLATLYNASMIQPSGLHLIGHSLGAHVAGYAGKTLQKEGWRIARITGLDPASILFNDPNRRLSKNDTDQLDVIHTCMKFLGIAGNIGHVDFYPNGGIASQPGCGFDWSGICSHGRSYEYFVESITRPKAFVGRFCDNNDVPNNCVSEITAVMGACLSYKKEGAYYLKTNETAPFGLGENFV